MAIKTLSTKRGQGRPTDYTPELGDEICAQLSGGESLRRVCAKKNMPSRQTVFTWLRVHEGFLDQYTRAKQETADALADDIEDIAIGVLNKKYDPQAARVAVDAKKWVASKLKPKKYGDKLDLTTDGKELPSPILGGIGAFNTLRDVKQPENDSEGA
jgi:hypothetical protein